ncbi:alpha-glucosidase [Bacillus sp. SLBN-46]|uniref:glycoside hydrolase family 31 protein n=1 Tax=Bacillus sp. SLBN-46 TaxID=3042283 RepID=UPI0028541EE5|nr:TIM-barrel domain-containing protein [Bacillus sp. SLBN-46]MDR6125285.1 alpha-glucosidase [Bacillus sp. SLBN-46]
MLISKEYQVHGSDFTFFSSHENMILRVINDSIINVRTEKATDTITTKNLKREEANIDIYSSDEGFELKTSKMLVRIDKETLKLSFFDHMGNVINQDHPKNLEKQHASFCYKTLKENEQFFGCGEQVGFLNQRGKKIQFWNYAEPKHFNAISNEMYQSIPFFISKENEMVYGLYFDNSFRSFFDFGTESSEYYSIGAEDGELNYYIIYGANIKEVLEHFTNLTGKSPLPPLWSLGYHQSKWSYFPEKRVYEVAKTFREKNIPCDSIHLDIDYMDNYKIFSFNKERFPNPKNMFHDLNELGYKMIAIVDPGVKMETGYDVYEQGKSNGYFCKNPDGSDFIGDVWPGGCAFPDFANQEVRSWWADLNKKFLEQGIRGIWNDLNEPSILVEPHTMSRDVIHRSIDGDRTHAEIHNLYANYEAMATLEGWEKFDESTRPFLLSRAGFAGIQKYAAVWTGDNTSSWDSLLISIPMFMNLGLSGIPFVGADVGGYAGECSEELLIRWMQLGAFTPLFRNHTRKEVRDQEPWAYSEKGENIMRKFIQLRYRLLPYFYTAFRETHEKGYPLFRPMIFNFENEVNTHNISDQFMIGDSLLVAPIYLPGQDYRAVYLPEGTWYDYWNNKKYNGGQYIVAKASLETMPLFVKSGAVIPEFPVMNYVGEKEINELKFNVYMGSGEYIYYEDDGASKEYLEQKYNKRKITVDSRDKEVFITVSPIFSGFESKVSTYRFTLNGIHSVSSIYLNDKNLNFIQKDNLVEFSTSAEEKIKIKITI